MEGDFVYVGPFAGWGDYSVRVTTLGAILMDRFGTCPSPDEAEAMGVALIKSAAIARERKEQQAEARAAA